MPSGLRFGTPNSFGRSLTIAGSADFGRSASRSSREFASTRPTRSCHGPVPMRSIAFSVVVLRNARQTLLLAHGLDDNAIFAHSASAPMMPPKLPPKPLVLPDSRVSAAWLVRKKLNLSSSGVSHLIEVVIAPPPPV